MRAARAAVCVLVAAAGLTVPLATTAQAAVPANFTDELVIGGLDMPTVAAFAPDGRVFIGEKGGVVKTFDSVSDDTATTAVDLSTQVHDYWDRGLLGLAVHPQYPAQPYVYALYSYDQKPGGGQWGDTCPNPPGGTTAGCVISGRLSKLTVDPSTGVSSSEQPLVTGWCQQFPSHSIGTVTFGPDGKLYVGGGDGASFNFEDYGQRGNPCGDPPSPAGTDLALPDARGGALRSQSPRRPAGEPRTLDGTIARVDPDSGTSTIVAYGMRNQFRFGFRPGSKELWVGDVGWGTWEEINRIPDATTDTVVENFGWPCYEGAARQSGYDGKNLDVCEQLYAVGQNPPYYAYRHDQAVVAGDGCGTGGSAVNGVAFEQGASYPPAYDGALFFADSSRGCIWAMRKGENGLPNPADIVPFVTGQQFPVQTLFGPGDHLYYVALGTGELRRVLYTGNNHAPSAKATATPSSGPAPLTVQFDGSGSTDQDGNPLTYRWDLDADGQFDDGTGPTASHTYVNAAVVPVKLRVADPDGLTDTVTVNVTVGEPAQQEPVVVIDTPSTDLKWHVGEAVSFAGRASDAQDGALGAAAMDWTLTLQHCTTPSSCHPHQVQSFADVDSGQFSAPDHSYPSYLDLTLAATDSDGNKAGKTVRLEPETVELTFESSPSGLDLTVGGTTEAAPFTRTVIVGSDNSLSAPSPQGTAQNTFVKWADSGSNSREFSASSTPKTYQASFVACAGVTGCGGPTPTAPRGISAVASGDTATVSWQAPHWPGTGGLTKYKVTASNGKVYDNLSASATSQTVTGLTAGQNHSFTVTPYSSSGAGTSATDKLTGTKLTSSATPTTVTYGASVQVKGTLSRADTGSLLTSKPVQLRGRATGTTDWDVLATGTTSSSGVVSFTRSPEMNYEYQLAYTGSGVYGGSVSPTRAVRVRMAVTAAFADSTVRVNETVNLSGRVDPPHPGQSIRLQYYYGGQWNNSLQATLSADSTYTFTWSKPVAKTYTYRVVKYGDSDHVSGVSPTRTLTVS